VVCRWAGQGGWRGVAVREMGRVRLGGGWGGRGGGRVRAREGDGGGGRHVVVWWVVVVQGWGLVEGWSL